MVVHGVSRTISPQMVTLVDTLPEGYTPTPYGPGEMYVQSPGKGSAAPAPPPLSTDAFWLVRRVRRRLAGFAPVADAPGRVAIVTAIDPLAAELRDKAALISSYLGLRELRVVGATSEALPHSHLEGRTRTGAHWSVALPGVPGHRLAPKHRPVRSTGRRVPDAADAASSSEIDYASEAVIAREESIRVLGRELDELVAAPLLGPAKVTIAWDAGLRSMQEYPRRPVRPGGGTRRIRPTGRGDPVGEAGAGGSASAPPSSAPGRERARSHSHRRSAARDGTPTGLCAACTAPVGHCSTAPSSRAKHAAPLHAGPDASASAGSSLSSPGRARRSSDSPGPTVFP